MVNGTFLSEDERNKIELVESRKQLDRSRKELAEAEKYLKSQSTSGRIKSFISQKPTQKIKGTSFSRPQLQSYSKEQALLNEMFSGNNNYLTGNNLPKISGVLITGQGLIKNNNQGQTRRLFLR